MSYGDGRGQRHWTGPLIAWPRIDAPEIEESIRKPAARIKAGYELATVKTKSRSNPARIRAKSQPLQHTTPGSPRKVPFARCRRNIGDRDGIGLASCRRPGALPKNAETCCAYLSSLTGPAVGPVRESARKRRRPVLPANRPSKRRGLAHLSRKHQRQSPQRAERDQHNECPRPSTQMGFPNRSSGTRSHAGRHRWRDVCERPNQVFALDARAGRTIWHYKRQRLVRRAAIRRKARIAAWLYSAIASSL